MVRGHVETGMRNTKLLVLAMSGHRLPVARNQAETRGVKRDRDRAH